MNTDEIVLPEFMNNESNNNKNIYKIMVLARSLLVRLRGRDPDEWTMIVQYNLLRPTRGLNWNNVADRVPIMRIEAINILRDLRGIDNRVDSSEPTPEQRKKIDSFIISLDNYLTTTASSATTAENEDSDDEYGGSAKSLRKRKRKSIKTKSKKSKKTRKSRR
jgi:Ni/Co efflux regulator RcnB